MIEDDELDDMTPFAQKIAAAMRVPVTPNPDFAERVMVGVRQYGPLNAPRHESSAVSSRSARRMTLSSWMRRSRHSWSIDRLVLSAVVTLGVTIMVVEAREKTLKTPTGAPTHRLAGLRHHEGGSTSAPSLLPVPSHSATRVADKGLTDKRVPDKTGVTPKAPSPEVVASPAHRDPLWGEVEATPAPPPPLDAATSLETEPPPALSVADVLVLVHQALPAATDAELGAAITAFQGGVPVNTFRELSRALPGRSLAVPLSVLGELVNQGIPERLATSAIVTMAARVDDRGLAEFGDSVKQDLAKGLLPPQALQRVADKTNILLSKH